MIQAVWLKGRNNVAIIRCVGLLAICNLLITPAIVRAQDPIIDDNIPFRFDGGNASKRWYQVGPLEFPPPKSEHREWACLSRIDAIDRCGEYRSEERDRMLDFTLLPYASVFYRGAPAALGDIPAGTFAEIQTYVDNDGRLHNRIFKIRDSFTVSQQAGIVYRVDSIKGKLFTVSPQWSTPTADGQAPGKVLGEEFDKIELAYGDGTQFYQGRSLAMPSDMQVGQLIRYNFIRRFWPGPPVWTHCREIWLDQESQELATTLQVKKYREYLKHRGLPARIDAANDQENTFTVSVIDSHAPDFLEELANAKMVRTAIAEENLRTYEPAGGQGGPDVVDCTVVSTRQIPMGQGGSGLEVTLKTRFLLDGLRGGRYVRLFPEHWHVGLLPIEERLPKEFHSKLR